MIVDNYTQLTNRFFDDAILGFKFRIDRIVDRENDTETKFLKLEEQLDILCFEEYGKAIKAEMLGYRILTPVSP